MALIAGIDLGTSTTLVSLLVNETPEIRPDPANAQLIVTPSVVYFPDGSEKPVVGINAERRRARHPDRVVAEVKRQIGTSDKFPAAVPQFRAYEVLAEILYYRLRELPSMAASMNETEIRAVISTPAYYGDLEKKRTKEAWEIAKQRLHADSSNQGFTFELDGVIDEPLAAAIYQCTQRNVFTGEPLLVFDLGGGTFDVTVYNAQTRPETGTLTVNVFAKDGEQRLGGADWNQVLAEIWCQEAGVAFDQLGNADRFELLEQCVKIRESLTDLEDDTIRASVDGRTVQRDITRREFEDESVELLERIENCLNGIEKFLKSEHHISFDAVQVLMVGGTTRMPMIKQTVENFFGKDRVHEHHSPQAAVVHGACLYGAILNQKEIKNRTLQQFRKIEICDILTRSYGILGNDRHSNSYGLQVVIPRNSMCNGREYVFEDACIDKDGRKQLEIEFGAVSQVSNEGEFIPQTRDEVFQRIQFDIPNGQTTLKGQPVHFILRPMPNGLIEGVATLRDHDDPSIELCRYDVRITSV